MDIRRLSRIGLVNTSNHLNDSVNLSRVFDDEKDDSRAEDILKKYENKRFEDLLRAMSSQLSRIKDEDKLMRRTAAFIKAAQTRSDYNGDTLKKYFKEVVGEDYFNKNPLKEVSAENKETESKETENKEIKSETPSNKYLYNKSRKLETNRGTYTYSFFNFLNKLIDKGFEIEVKLSNSSSRAAREMASRNGRVWDLAYDVKFMKDGKTYSTFLSVVTNEGGGNYGYTIDSYHFYRSFREFTNELIRDLEVQFGSIDSKVSDSNDVDIDTAISVSLDEGTFEFPDGTRLDSSVEDGVVEMYYVGSDDTYHFLFSGEAESSEDLSSEDYKFIRKSLQKFYQF